MPRIGDIDTPTAEVLVTASGAAVDNVRVHEPGRAQLDGREVSLAGTTRVRSWPSARGRTT